MDTLLEYKCPACGGALSFDSGLQKMKCPYCDTEFEVEAMKELDRELENQQEDEMSWQERRDAGWQEGEAESLGAYVCQSCGGEIIAEETTAATSCPYCGNPVVMARQVSGELRPDCIIPFALDKDAAVEALHKFLNGKLLLPKVFKSENHIQKIQGVYVPFWLYDTHAAGSARYHAKRVRHWSDSDYNYTETKHYSVSRAGELDFEAVPVDGSGKMSDTLMESLEPYDVSKAVDFQTAYLAGYLADKYDLDVKQCAPRANDRIKASTQQTLLDTVTGYTDVDLEQGNVRFSDGATRYALYPVWLLHTKYRDTDYLFAMNGQTGKLVGDLPVDWGKYWLWWAGVFVAASGLTVLLARLLGFL